jgi:hypothetical protein
LAFYCCYFFSPQNNAIQIYAVNNNHELIRNSFDIGNLTLASGLTATDLNVVNSVNLPLFFLLKTAATKSEWFMLKTKWYNNYDFGKIRFKSSIGLNNSEDM